MMKIHGIAPLPQNDYLRAREAEGEFGCVRFFFGGVVSDKSTGSRIRVFPLHYLMQI